MNNTTEIPCTDLDLERRFVATKLTAGHLIVGNDIDPNDLSVPKLRDIYRVCRYLDDNIDRWGYEDVVTQLEQDGHLKTVGKDYLRELALDIDATLLDGRPAATRLKTLAIARQKRNRLQDAILAVESAEYEKADELITRLFESANGLEASPIYSATDMADETRRALVSIQSGENIVLKTGLTHFDHVADGLLPGGMLTIATYPNIGKSQLALLIGVNVARAGNPVGILSLEDPVLLTGSRLVSHITDRLSSRNLFSGEYGTEVIDRMIRALDDHAQAFRALPLYLSQCGTHSPADIYDVAIQMIREHKCKVLALDYVQSVMVGDKAKRNEALAAVASRLKALCAKHGIAFICASQVTQGEGSIYREPTPGQVRDTKDLWQITDQMVMLWKTQIDSPIYWRLSKSKSGNVGSGGVVKINPATGMFADLVKKDEI